MVSERAHMNSLAHFLKEATESGAGREDRRLSAVKLGGGGIIGSGQLRRSTMELQLPRIGR